MSDKPRIGSILHGETYPDKLAVYSLDFYRGQRAGCMPEPWAVDRGNEGLGSFATYEEAVAYVREEIAKCVST